MRCKSKKAAVRNITSLDREKENPTVIITKHLVPSHVGYHIGIAWDIIGYNIRTSKDITLGYHRISH